MSSGVFSAVFQSEFGHLLHHPRVLHLLPAALLAVSVTVTLQPVDPFLPALLAAFCAMEAQFNALVFRTRGEADALRVLPVNWRIIVAAKNAATLLLTAGTAACMIIVCAPFLHHPPGAHTLAGALGHAGSVAFLLLAVGNLRSIQDERPELGWQLTDLTEAFGMLVTAIVCSVPYWVIREALGGAWAVGICTAAGALVWAGYSLPSTATAMKRGKPSHAQAGPLPAVNHQHLHEE